MIPEIKVYDDAKKAANGGHEFDFTVTIYNLRN